MTDDECIHLNDPVLCTICNGKDAAGKRTVRKAAAAPSVPRPKGTKSVPTKAPSKRLTTTVVSTRSADTEETVEQYRSGYSGDRAATFDAYVEVFFNTEARDFSGGFLAFTRCANADPERKATTPALVARAERLMRDAGYAADRVGTAAVGRRWFLAD